MASININEYDYTITGPKTYSDNIVALPINATDGPSDRWVTINTYDDFVQTFGPNPDTASVFGNSWEYAANLLLRKMPVCVRRITHELNEDGTNKPNVLLPDVSSSKGIIKIKDVVGNSTVNSNNLVESVISIHDSSNHAKLQTSYPGDIRDNPYYITKTNENGTKGIFTSVYELQQTNPNLNAINVFADVKDDGTNYPKIATENEWNYIGPHNNPHYRTLTKDKKYVNSLDELFDNIYSDEGDPSGNYGDFYLLKNSDNAYTRIDYIYPAKQNKKCIFGNGIIQYPDALLSIKNNNGASLTTNDFTYVTYDSKSNLLTFTPENKTWVYTGLKILENAEDIKTNDIYYIISENAFYINKTVFCYLATEYTEETQNRTVTQIFKFNNKTIITNNNEPIYVFTNNKFSLYTYVKNKYEEQLNEDENETPNLNISYNDGNKIFNITSYISIVSNHRYVGSYNNYDALPDISNGSTLENNTFAYNENDKYIYYVLNGEWKVSENTTLNTLNIVTNEIAIETIYNNPSQFIMIPWINTNINKNTGRYTQLVSWDVAEGEDKNQYLETIYWENSNNPINTRPHTVLVNTKVYINDININAMANVDRTSIDLSVNKHNDIEIDNDYSDTRLSSGKVEFTNNSYNPIKIYSLRLTQKNNNGSISLLYDANLNKIKSVNDCITYDPLLQIVNNVGDIITTASIPVLLDTTSGEDRWYFELDPGATLSYNVNLTGLQLNMGVAVFDDTDIVYHLFSSNIGKYDVCLSTLDNEFEVIKSAIPEIEDNDDINNLQINDGRGNFNLFTAEYLYPGSNGNSLNIRVKTTKNQGIYVYVYKNNQYLERIELCAFKQRLSNGKVKILDINNDKESIWRTLLLKFGILPGINDETAAPSSIYGNYIKLDLNPNISDYMSYDYIDSLYAQTGTQITKLQDGHNPNDDHVIHEIPYCYEPLKDKYRYDIKFVSNGGYIDKLVLSSSITSTIHNDEDVRLIEDAMLDLVSSRKDCVAYLDSPFDLAIEDVPFYFEHISSSYAAAYDPWAYISLNTGSIKWMPPSFVQLYTHAKSIMGGNKMYLPPAGVRRALVPEILKTNHDLPSTYISTWQDNESVQFINPIIWINGFDYTIYGQKTLYNIVNQSDRYESALQNLNVRLVSNEIKKLIFKTCIELTFELNNLMTWNEFKSKVEPLLSVMQGEGVLTNYSLLMGSETMTAADLNSGHIVGTVRVSIASAATDWDINFEIQPNEVTFNEADYNSSYTE